MEESIPVEDKEVVQTLAAVVETASVESDTMEDMGMMRMVTGVPF